MRKKAWPEWAECEVCGKARRSSNRGHRPVAFPVPQSRLEDALGHETSQCEHCGAKYKVVPH